MKAYEKIVVCVVLVSVVALFSCSKKDDTSSAAPAGDGAAEVDAGGGAAVVDAGGGSAAKVDASKPVAEVKAEAEKMDVGSLRATALSYKEAILSNEGKIKTLSDQLKKIPLAQQLGDEAKGLQSEIKTLTDSTSALLERFTVYYDKLKEKGGDVSGLKP